VGKSEKMKNSRSTVLIVFVFFIVSELWLPLVIGGGPSTVSFLDETAYHTYHSRYNQAEVTDISQRDAHFTPVVGSAIQNSGKMVQNTQSSNRGLLDSPWPMMSHDVFHTGRSPFNTTQPPEGVEIWRFGSSDSFDGGVIVDDEGMLYCGSVDCHMYSIYPNGTLRWKTNLYRCMESTPAIDENGIVYIGTALDSNCLFALYSNNGTVKWSYPTGNFIDSSPAIGIDGTIYFGDWSGYVHALHPDGTVKWKYHTGDIITGSPAIGPDGTVYIGSHDNSLYAFYPDNGTVKWRYYTGGWVRVSPCVGDDGTVYCVSFDSYLHAIYPNNGTMKWKTFVNAGTNPTVGPDGTIYAGWDVLYAVNPDGSVKWTFGGYAAIEGGTPCTSKEGIIYFGNTDGKILAVNSNGTLRWIRNLTHQCQSPPAIDSNGFIYIGSESSGAAIHAFGHGPLKVEAYGPYEGLVNTSVQFTGDGFGGALPYTFLWDFGDHQTSNEQNPKHLYTGPGIFNVILTIQDGSGNSTIDNATASITYPGPTVSIIKPKSGIYIFDIRFIPIPFIRPIIFGTITIKAQANQIPLGISHVDFYADEKFLGTDTSAPYSCVWRGALNPRLTDHGIYVRAYDNGGKETRAQIYVFKLF
jgi:outer membrane protein assembly factor BamB